MMLIGESEMDDRGRITIPKSFRKANNLEGCTKVRFCPIAVERRTGATSGSIKLIFVKEGE